MRNSSPPRAMSSSSFTLLVWSFWCKLDLPWFALVVSVKIMFKIPCSRIYLMRAEQPLRFFRLGVSWGDLLWWIITIHYFLPWWTSTQFFFLLFLSLIQDAFASGDEGDGRTFIGSRNFFLMDMVDDETGGEYTVWLFNFAFAATSGTYRNGFFLYCF